MAAAPEYPPSARPDALLYCHRIRSIGPRGAANLLAPCSSRGAGRSRTLPVAGVPSNLLGLAHSRALVPLPLLETLQSGRQC